MGRDEPELSRTVGSFGQTDGARRRGELLRQCAAITFIPCQGNVKTARLRLEICWIGIARS